MDMLSVHDGRYATARQLFALHVLLITIAIPSNRLHLTGEFVDRPDGRNSFFTSQVISHGGLPSKPIQVKTMSSDSATYTIKPVFIILVYEI